MFRLFKIQVDLLGKLIYRHSCDLCSISGQLALAIIAKKSRHPLEIVSGNELKKFNFMAFLFREYFSFRQFTTL